MIARYYGHDIDLAALRKRHLVSLTGASLKSMIGIAGTLDLATRPLSLDMEHLPKLALPAILHWDFNHYVVLSKVTSKYAEIHDPGIGRRRVPLSEFSKHFTGVALELSPLARFTPQTARLRPHLAMLWRTLTGLKRALAQTLLLSLILQATILASPFLLQIVVDGVLPNGDHGLLLALAIGFGGLAMLKAGSEGARNWAILSYGNQMSLQMLGNVFHHLMRLPVSFFEKRHIGDLISRMGSAQPIQKALTQTVVSTVIDGVMAILMLIVMFIYAPLLAAIVLLSVALLGGATLLIYPHIRAAQEEELLARAVENTHVIETIRAATTLKLFGREAEREGHWRNLYAGALSANLKYGRLTIAQRFTETALTGLQLIIIVYLGARLIMDSGQFGSGGGSVSAGGFTLGMLFAFLAYRAEFTRAVSELIRKGIEFRLLGLHLDRLSDIVFAEVETGLETGQPLNASEFKGEIVIENLWFRYSDLGPWVLEDVSLRIKAGSMITITGLSGGGKTTLLKLILGLYTPTRGRILIDGQDLRTLSLRSWRQAMGVVMQDDQLLSGSIAENISLFDPDLDLRRVAGAAGAARIHADISAIPMGYDSLIGNMGSVLSGGQKQRVLLARALYHQPKILFLDEGTANLDQQTEGEIVDILANMPLTRIIIAHRPAFIKASDAVFRL
jgi:ATP-binding cassette subfamily B protein RaxB